MRSVLGISAFYHDSAAALVIDGEIVAAAQEERFTRIKHDHRFPQHAVDYCLAAGGLKANDLDAVVFYEKPFLKFERLMESYIGAAPRGLRSFMKALPLWLNQKLFLPREIDKGLGNSYEGPIYFTTHHASHAASAFFPSPFEEAAIITFDGVGEWSTSTWGIGRGNRIELLKEVRFPHSLGLLYSAFTYYTGFKVNSAEYKLMGLAPYGEPRFVDQILDNLIDVKEDGSFWLDQAYFNYSAGLRMTNERFHTLFGEQPRRPESEITQFHMDVAASIQKVTEDVMLKIAAHVQRETGMENLCMAGGVALNCVANGLIERAGPFKNIWVQPAAGDAGGSLGAALFAWHQLWGNSRLPEQPDSQQGSLLGPQYTNDEIRRFLDSAKASYLFYKDENELCDTIARLIDSGKVIGLMAGRMEFGPRALGARSIIGDPRNPEMQAKMNLKIKFRESFRPFAPSCLVDRTSEYFDLDTESPYMLLVAPVREERRVAPSDEQQKYFGIDKLNVLRSDLPAITHVDYSARIQTVDPQRNPRYYKILKAFEKMTGCGVVVNTSFNIRGEPIVCSPEEAYRCFMFTDMDALVLESFIA
jgi:carbamoyltransferase